ncbi:RagB/SusD family nutrient uptake outer membrane protein [Siphonobacter sp. SORGH_AS_0500]|uniref:RagB/SusD family nutrient uptake outer membrane protein n=1 Tax=Siphonobacter sp. SORGH_AS_0500 TaxID=1864824 RepID=UPI00285B3B5E|nr:RagB/SusD family nutrient uptake outer membrane protein [Siphonobacter sp. SORGH_AS_0500]MDR6193313.1 hypothetical protein [Siphonobacter sp. SORGH_AS_0500]
MKRSIFLLTLVLGPVLFSSCDKYLQLEHRSVADEKSFYKTSQDAIVATNAAYNPLQEIHRSTQGIWLLAEVASDNTDDPDVSIDNLTLGTSHAAVLQAWQYHYLGIARCNTVLNRLPGISMDASLRNRLMLEAQFLRGLYYFNLVRLFGPVPLVTQETKDLEQTLPTNLPARASEDEIYTQIIADFTAAEALPATYSSSDLGRATRGAAKAYLAKVYLTRKNWAQAAAKAKEVMDSQVYQLLPSYANVFAVTQKNSRESIFEVQYFIGAQSGTGNFLGHNLHELFAPAGSGSSVTGVTGSNGVGRNIPSDELVEAYEAGDPRKEASLKTSYINASGNVVNVNYTLKYLDPSATGGTQGGSGVGSSNSVRVYRYADLLLVYAEALNEQQGGSQEALEALNSVRRRARSGQSGILPDWTGLSQAALREAIDRERRVELAFENHRWFDLVRTGKAKAVLVQTKNIQIRNTLYPIPERERTINPKLTQNDGY